ncbi:FG-GAP-like repeat-containing protein [Lentzea californiensis]|uniref:FG-GAP-like repeat-containing protein n=1 Tax=Lentzea californiensis TaxID=438851 RepID=UPI002164FE22|nr:FG-GAP-like repeat-containing protein [Lentzea californiensis]MCR3753082.1 Repeat domain-containing protein [Lentzea californiensis]
MKLTGTITRATTTLLSAAVLSPLLLAGQAQAATGTDIANLANANEGKMACSTNSLGGQYFLSSCTGFSGRPEYWCADFAKWVWMNVGGISTIGLNPAARSFYSYGVNNGTLSNTPNIGDAAIFSDTNSVYDIDHVAIVVAVNSNGTVRVQNGNWDGGSGDQPTTSGRSRVVPVTLNGTTGTYSASEGYYLMKYVRPAGVSDAPPPPAWGKADVVKLNASGSLTSWQNFDALGGKWFAPEGIGGVDTADPARVKYGDLDGDGKDDVVRINADGSLTGWKNSNALTGSWHAPSTIGSVGAADPAHIQLADLNGDKRADLIKVNPDGSLTAWQNNNALAASWHAPVWIGNTGPVDPTQLRFADLNGDRKTDLVKVHPDGALTAWQNNNALAGSWHAPVGIGGVGEGPTAGVKFADLNADGKAEVIKVGPEGSLVTWQNNNALAGSWHAPAGIGSVGVTEPERVEFPDLG